MTMATSTEKLGGIRSPLPPLLLPLCLVSSSTALWSGWWLHNFTPCHLAWHFKSSCWIFCFLSSMPANSNHRHRWVLGKEICLLTAFVNFIVAGACEMFVFVVDRLSVFFPYFYLKYKVKVVVSFSAFSWLSLECYKLAGYLGLYCYTFMLNSNYCSISTTCGRGCFTYINTIIATLFVPPTVVPLFLFGILYCKAIYILQGT